MNRISRSALIFYSSLIRSEMQVIDPQNHSQMSELGFKSADALAMYDAIRSREKKMIRFSEGSKALAINLNASNEPVVSLVDIDDVSTGKVAGFSEIDANALKSSPDRCYTCTKPYWQDIVNTLEFAVSSSQKLSCFVEDGENKSIIRINLAFGIEINIILYPDNKCVIEGGIYGLVKDIKQINIAKNKIDNIIDALDTLKPSWEDFFRDITDRLNCIKKCFEQLSQNIKVSGINFHTGDELLKYETWDMLKRKDLEEKDKKPILFEKKDTNYVLAGKCHDCIHLVKVGKGFKNVFLSTAYPLKMFSEYFPIAVVNTSIDGQSNEGMCNLPGLGSFIYEDQEFEDESNTSSISLLDSKVFNVKYDESSGIVDFRPLFAIANPSDVLPFCDKVQPINVQIENQKFVLEPSVSQLHHKTRSTKRLSITYIVQHLAAFKNPLKLSDDPRLLKSLDEIISQIEDSFSRVMLMNQGMKNAKFNTIDDMIRRFLISIIIDPDKPDPALEESVQQIDLQAIRTAIREYRKMHPLEEKSDPISSSDLNVKYDGLADSVDTTSQKDCVQVIINNNKIYSACSIGSTTGMLYKQGDEEYVELFQVVQVDGEVSRGLTSIAKGIAKKFVDQKCSSTDEQTLVKKFEVMAKVILDLDLASTKSLVDSDIRTVDGDGHIYKIQLIGDQKLVVSESTRYEESSQQLCAIHIDYKNRTIGMSNSFGFKAVEWVEGSLKSIFARFFTINAFDADKLVQACEEKKDTESLHDNSKINSLLAFMFEVMSQLNFSQSKAYDSTIYYQPAVITVLNGLKNGDIVPENALQQCIYLINREAGANQNLLTEFNAYSSLEEKEKKAKDDTFNEFIVYMNSQAQEIENKDKAWLFDLVARHRNIAVILYTLANSNFELALEELKNPKSRLLRVFNNKAETGVLKLKTKEMPLENIIEHLDKNRMFEPFERPDKKASIIATKASEPNAVEEIMIEVLGNNDKVQKFLQVVAGYQDDVASADIQCDDIIEKNDKYENYLRVIDNKGTWKGRLKDLTKEEVKDFLVLYIYTNKFVSIFKEISFNKSIGAICESAYISTANQDQGKNIYDALGLQSADSIVFANWLRILFWRNPGLGNILIKVYKDASSTDIENRKQALIDICGKVAELPLVLSSDVKDWTKDAWNILANNNFTDLISLLNGYPAMDVKGLGIRYQGYSELCKDFLRLCRDLAMPNTPMSDSSLANGAFFASSLLRGQMFKDTMISEFNIDLDIDVMNRLILKVLDLPISVKKHILMLAKIIDSNALLIQLDTAKKWMEMIRGIPLANKRRHPATSQDKRSEHVGYLWLDKGKRRYLIYERYCVDAHCYKYYDGQKEISIQRPQKDIPIPRIDSLGICNPLSIGNILDKSKLSQTQKQNLESNLRRLYPVYLASPGSDPQNLTPYADGVVETGKLLYCGDFPRKDNGEINIEGHLNSTIPDLPTMLDPKPALSDGLLSYKALKGLSFHLSDLDRIYEHLTNAVLNEKFCDALLLEAIQYANSIPLEHRTLDIVILLEIAESVPSVNKFLDQRGGHDLQAILGTFFTGGSKGPITTEDKRNLMIKLDVISGGCTGMSFLSLLRTAKRNSNTNPFATKLLEHLVGETNVDAQLAKTQINSMREIRIQFNNWLETAMISAAKRDVFQVLSEILTKLEEYPEAIDYFMGIVGLVKATSLEKVIIAICRLAYKMRINNKKPISDIDELKFALVHRLFRDEDVDFSDSIEEVLDVVRDVINANRYKDLFNIEALKEHMEDKVFSQDPVTMDDTSTLQFDYTSEMQSIFKSLQAIEKAFASSSAAKIVLTTSCPANSDIMKKLYEELGLSYDSSVLDALFSLNDYNEQIEAFVNIKYPGFLKSFADDKIPSTTNKQGFFKLIQKIDKDQEIAQVPITEDNALQLFLAKINSYFKPRRPGQIEELFVKSVRKKIGAMLCFGVELEQVLSEIYAGPEEEKNKVKRQIIKQIALSSNGSTNCMCDLLNLVLVHQDQSTASTKVVSCNLYTSAKGIPVMSSNIFSCAYLITDQLGIKISTAEYQIFESICKGELLQDLALTNFISFISSLPPEFKDLFIKIKNRIPVKMSAVFNFFNSRIGTTDLFNSFKTIYEQLKISDELVVIPIASSSLKPGEGMLSNSIQYTIESASSKPWNASDCLPEQTKLAGKESLENTLNEQKGVLYSMLKKPKPISTRIISKHGEAYGDMFYKSFFEKLQSLQKAINDSFEKYPVQHLELLDSFKLKTFRFAQYGVEDSVLNSVTQAVTKQSLPQDVKIVIKKDSFLCLNAIYEILAGELKNQIEQLKESLTESEDDKKLLDKLNQLLNQKLWSTSAIYTAIQSGVIFLKSRTTIGGIIKSRSMMCFADGASKEKLSDEWSQSSELPQFDYRLMLNPIGLLLEELFVKQRKLSDLNPALVKAAIRESEFLGISIGQTIENYNSPKALENFKNGIAIYCQSNNLIVQCLQGIDNSFALTPSEVGAQFNCEPILSSTVGSLIQHVIDQFRSWGHSPRIFCIKLKFFTALTLPTPQEREHAFASLVPDFQELNRLFSDKHLDFTLLYFYLRQKEFNYANSMAFKHVDDFPILDSIPKMQKEQNHFISSDGLRIGGMLRKVSHLHYVNHDEPGGALLMIITKIGHYFTNKGQTVSPDSANARNVLMALSVIMQGLLSTFSLQEAFGLALSSGVSAMIKQPTSFSEGIYANELLSYCAQNGPNMNILSGRSFKQCLRLAIVVIRYLWPNDPDHCNKVGEAIIEAFRNLNGSFYDKAETKLQLKSDKIAVLYMSVERYGKLTKSDRHAFTESYNMFSRLRSSKKILTANEFYRLYQAFHNMLFLIADKIMRCSVDDLAKLSDRHDELGPLVNAIKEALEEFDNLIKTRSDQLCVALVVSKKPIETDANSAIDRIVDSIVVGMLSRASKACLTKIAYEEIKALLMLHRDEYVASNIRSIDVNEDILPQLALETKQLIVPSEKRKLNVDELDEYIVELMKTDLTLQKSFDKITKSIGYGNQELNAESYRALSEAVSNDLLASGDSQYINTVIRHVRNILPKKVDVSMRKAIRYLLITIKAKSNDNSNSEIPPPSVNLILLLGVKLEENAKVAIKKIPKVSDLLNAVFRIFVGIINKLRTVSGLAAPVLLKSMEFFGGFYAFEELEKAIGGFYQPLSNVFRLLTDPTNPEPLSEPTRLYSILSEAESENVRAFILNYTNLPAPVSQSMDETVDFVLREIYNMTLDHPPVSGEMKTLSKSGIWPSFALFLKGFFFSQGGDEDLKFDISFDSAESVPLSSLVMLFAFGATSPFKLNQRRKKPNAIEGSLAELMSIMSDHFSKNNSKPIQRVSVYFACQFLKLIKIIDEDEARGFNKDLSKILRAGPEDRAFQALESICCKLLAIGTNRSIEENYDDDLEVLYKDSPDIFAVFQKSKKMIETFRCILLSILMPDPIISAISLHGVNLAITQDTFDLCEQQKGKMKSFVHNSDTLTQKLDEALSSDLQKQLIDLKTIEELIIVMQYASDSNKSKAVIGKNLKAHSVLAYAMLCKKGVNPNLVELKAIGLSFANAMKTLEVQGDVTSYIFTKWLGDFSHGAFDKRILQIQAYRMKLRTISIEGDKFKNVEFSKYCKDFRATEKGIDLYTDIINGVDKTADFMHFSLSNLPDTKHDLNARMQSLKSTEPEFEKCINQLRGRMPALMNMGPGVWNIGDHPSANQLNAREFLLCQAKKIMISFKEVGTPVGPVAKQYSEAIKTALVNANTEFSSDLGCLYALLKQEGCKMGSLLDLKAIGVDDSLYLEGADLFKDSKKEIKMDNDFLVLQLNKIIEVNEQRDQEEIKPMSADDSIFVKLTKGVTVLLGKQILCCSALMYIVDLCRHSKNDEVKKIAQELYDLIDIGEVGEIILKIKRLKQAIENTANLIIRCMDINVFESGDRMKYAQSLFPEGAFQACANSGSIALRNNQILGDMTSKNVIANNSADTDDVNAATTTASTTTVNTYKTVNQNGKAHRMYYECAAKVEKQCANHDMAKIFVELKNPTLGVLVCCVEGVNCEIFFDLASESNEMPRMTIDALDVSKNQMKGAVKKIIEAIRSLNVYELNIFADQFKVLAQNIGEPRPAQLPYIAVLKDIAREAVVPVRSYIYGYGVQLKEDGRQMHIDFGHINTEFEELAKREGLKLPTVTSRDVHDMLIENLDPTTDLYKQMESIEFSMSNITQHLEHFQNAFRIIRGLYESGFEASWHDGVLTQIHCQGETANMSDRQLYEAFYSLAWIVKIQDFITRLRYKSSVADLVLKSMPIWQSVRNVIGGLLKCGDKYKPSDNPTMKVNPLFSKPASHSEFQVLIKANPLLNLAYLLNPFAQANLMNKFAQATKKAIDSYDCDGLALLYREICQSIRKLNNPELNSKDIQMSFTVKELFDRMVHEFSPAGKIETKYYNLGLYEDRKRGYILKTSADKSCLILGKVTNSDKTGIITRVTGFPLPTESNLDSLTKLIIDQMSRDLGWGSVIDESEIRNYLEFEVAKGILTRADIEYADQLKEKVKYMNISFKNEIVFFDRPFFEEEEKQTAYLIQKLQDALYNNHRDVTQRVIIKASYLLATEDLDQLIEKTYKGVKNIGSDDEPIIMGVNGKIPCTDPEYSNLAFIAKYSTANAKSCVRSLQEALEVSVIQSDVDTGMKIVGSPKVSKFVVDANNTIEFSLRYTISDSIGCYRKIWIKFSELFYFMQFNPLPIETCPLLEAVLNDILKKLDTLYKQSYDQKLKSWSLMVNKMLIDFKEGASKQEGEMMASCTSNIDSFSENLPYTFTEEHGINLSGTKSRLMQLGEIPALLTNVVSGIMMNPNHDKILPRLPIYAYMNGKSVYFKHKTEQGTAIGACIMGGDQINQHDISTPIIPPKLLWGAFRQSTGGVLIGKTQTQKPPASVQGYVLRLLPLLIVCVLLILITYWITNQLIKQKPLTNPNSLPKDDTQISVRKANILAQHYKLPMPYLANPHRIRSRLKRK